jgi:large subunit ribosomal protein L22
MTPKRLQVKARLRFARLSPYRGRLVARTLKGLSVVEAERRLEVMPQKAARLLLKALRSATANAKENYGASSTTLRVREVLVDEGPKLRRLLPRARGRADIIRRPTAHLTVILEGAAFREEKVRRRKRRAKPPAPRQESEEQRSQEKEEKTARVASPRLAAAEREVKRRPTMETVRRFFRRKSAGG